MLAFDRFAAQHSTAPDTPEIEDFILGALTEAQHQRARWGETHDRSKSAENWYWLVGYLAGKALRASIQGDREKALHHTISAAAALSQWHEAIKRDTSGSGVGEDADLQPAETVITGVSPRYGETPRSVNEVITQETPTEPERIGSHETPPSGMNEALTSEISQT